MYSGAPTTPPSVVTAKKMMLTHWSPGVDLDSVVISGDKPGLDGVSAPIIRIGRRRTLWNAANFSRSSANERQDSLRPLPRPLVQHEYAAVDGRQAAIGENVRKYLIFMGLTEGIVNAREHQG